MLLDKPSRSTAVILSLSLLRSVTDTPTRAHCLQAQLPPCSGLTRWDVLCSQPNWPPRCPPKHWPLTCLCNFPFLPLSVPPYRLCPSFRAQLQPCSPGRPPCPGEAIGQPLWRVACIMYRCHCPPVQTPYVLRRPSSLALF